MPSCGVSRTSVDPARPSKVATGCDLEKTGLAEDRRRLEDLRGVEVAQIGERLAVLGRLPSVGNRPLLAVIAEGLERN